MWLLKDLWKYINLTRGGKLMSDNLIVYWRNWLDKEIDIPTTSNGYILKYTIVNQMNLIII